MAIFLSQRELKAIKEVVNYLEHDEFKHWQECNQDKDHIFNKGVRPLLRLRDIAENKGL